MPPESKATSAFNWILKVGPLVALMAMALLATKFPSEASFTKLVDKMDRVTMNLTDLTTLFKVSLGDSVRDAEKVRDHEARIRAIEAQIVALSAVVAAQKKP